MFGIQPKQNLTPTDTAQQNPADVSNTQVAPVIPPQKQKKPGIFAALFPQKTNKNEPFVKPALDPETGGILHATVEKKFKRMTFMEKYSYRGTKVVFIILGVIFFIIAFYLGYLAVRAILPPPDTDHDGIADSQDKCPGFDDRTDQDRDGTPDSCDKAVTPADFSDITFSTPTLVTADDKTYDVVFEATDANKTWGVTNLKYKVEVLSASGSVLKSQISTTYVNPASSTTIIEPNISTSEKAASARVSLLSGDFAALFSTQNLTLIIKNKTFTPRTDNGTALFTGVLQNNSNFDLQVVNVTMVVKGKNGAVVVDNLINVNTVHAGESRYFELRFPQSLDPSVTYDVVALTNGMDQANLIPKQGGGSQF